MADCEFDADLCVIGGGAAALAATSAAAVLGVSPVIVVDRVGRATASESLAIAAFAAAAGRTALRGIAGDPPAAFARAREEVRAAIERNALDHSPARLGALGAAVVMGGARFVDADTLAIGERMIRARRFILAVETKPWVPPLPGLDGTPYLTSDTALDLKEPPRQLVVLGAGPAGLALAQAFRRFGSAVAVLDPARPLADADADAAELVVEALLREGISIRSGVDVRRVEKMRAGVRVAFVAGGREESIEASHLLMAAGREPVLDGLGLEAAGIEGAGTAIRVDAKLRTTNKRVFAVGAAAGAEGDAEWQAALAVRPALFRRPIHAPVPRVAFTDPELAQVGMREEEARRAHGAIRILRWPYSENDRARIERTTQGMVKILTTNSGRVLGATIVGAQVRESIALFAMAVAKRMHVSALASLAFPQPAFAEAARRAASSDLTGRLTNPWVQRMFRLLRSFG